MCRLGVILGLVLMELSAVCDEPDIQAFAWWVTEQIMVPAEAAREVKRRPTWV